MKRINITAELLEKYHKGLCSEKERLAVEDWLNDEEDQVRFVHDLEQELALESEMWRSVTNRELSGRSGVLKHIRSWHYVAASVVLLLVGFVVGNRSAFYAYENEVVLELNSKTGGLEHVSREDLTFTTPPGSAMQLVTNRGWDKDEIRFCDMAFIHNKGKRDVRLKVMVACEDGRTLPYNYVVKAGEKYLAFRMEDAGSLVEKDVFFLPVSQASEPRMLPMEVQLELKKRMESLSII